MADAMDYKPRTRFQRFPARGARGYVGKPPKNPVPAKHIAKVEFEVDTEGVKHAVIELANRSGSAAKFTFEGLDTQESVSLDGASNTVVFYTVKFDAEAVSVSVDGSILVEETVPNGGSES